jgi:hypothetical protein
MCRIRRALRHSWAQKSTAESMCSAKSTLAALVLVAPAAAYVSVTPAAHATAHHRPMAMRPRFQNPQLQLDVLAAVDTFYQTSPIQAAFLTCGVKASLSDTISQRSVEMVCSKTGKVTAHRFCFSRNGAFILYGALYQGVTQHLIYNDIYPVIFGTGTDAGTVAAKVVFDQLVHAPLLALPVAYLVKAAVFKYPLAEGLQRYAADAQRDLLWKYWLLWTPVQCLTFSVVPEHLRIPFIAVVSFFWLIVLSNISSRPEPSKVGKAVICFDDQCIAAGEIDDDFDVSILDTVDVEKTSDGPSGSGSGSSPNSSSGGRRSASSSAGSSRSVIVTRIEAPSTTDSERAAPSAKL